MSLEIIVPKRNGDHEATRLTFVPAVFEPNGLLLNEFWRASWLVAAGCCMEKPSRIISTKSVDLLLILWSQAFQVLSISYQIKLRLCKRFTSSLTSPEVKGTPEMWGGSRGTGLWEIRNMTKTVHLMMKYADIC
jgi:hypothetical protein